MTVGGSSSLTVYPFLAGVRVIVRSVQPYACRHYGGPRSPHAFRRGQAARHRARKYAGVSRARMSPCEVAGGLRVAGPPAEPCAAHTSAGPHTSPEVCAPAGVCAVREASGRPRGTTGGGDRNYGAVSGGQRALRWSRPVLAARVYASQLAHPVRGARAGCEDGQFGAAGGAGALFVGESAPLMWHELHSAHLMPHVWRIPQGSTTGATGRGRSRADRALGDPPTDTRQQRREAVAAPAVNLIDSTSGQSDTPAN
jgi:hypothetical protein